MIELPHIPVPRTEALQGKCDLAVLPLLVLWECEVGQDAAQQPGASLVLPHCCST